MRSLAAVLLVIAALGCDGATRYIGVGDVVEVDAGASRITIRHDDIPGLMGAMTMAFPVRSPDLLAGVTTGTRVRFDLERTGNTLVVTRLVGIGVAGGPRPGVHDHTPHHGGVVAMIGLRHLEAAATPDGTIRAYVTDVWRRPLPLADATGTATLALPDGRRDVALAVRGDALEGHGPRLTAAEVPAHVAVTQGGEPLDSYFVLPLTGTAMGAANVPRAGCTAPERAGPRCVLDFGGSVTFVTPTPDGTTALVAVLNGGVTAWRIPAGEFARGFAAPPPVEGPAIEGPHALAPNAIAVRPDGREAAIALENRILVYDAASGRFARQLGPFRGVVRSLAWAPDGASVVASVFYDPEAHQLRADDGTELRTLPVEREAAAVAIAADGRVAVGSEQGGIAVFDPSATTAAKRLATSPRSVEALTFAGARLVASGYDGVVRFWDGEGRSVAETEGAGPVLRLAASPDGRLVAAGGLGRVIRVYDAATGALLSSLDWHESAVWGLAWSGGTLVSGDAAGRLALWDVSQRSNPDH